MRRWLPLAFSLLSFCPEQDTNKCNDDRDCEEDAGERCQILSDPETGKKDGNCVVGGQPVAA
jgi:hypothetical protein